MSWIQTFTNKKVWPSKPWENNDDSFCLEDIAHSLSMQCRFNGHTKEFYSVAQHSVVIADALFPLYGPEVALDGLMHDAAEAYLCDIPRPIKEDLHIYKTMEAALLKQIYKSLNIKKTESGIIKEFDDRALHTEALQLFDTQVDNWIGALNVEPLNVNLAPLYMPHHIEPIFLRKYHYYNELIKEDKDEK